MILITGASGFLGSAIAKLAHSRGLAVRALVRPQSDRSRLTLPAGSIVEGDMTDAASLRRATLGATSVIHCAAVTSVGAPNAQRSWSVNVEGMRDLVDACRVAPVARFIQISSQSATAENPSVYGSTKYEADDLLRQSSLDWTVLRPGLIYGPGKAAIFNKVVEFTEKFPVVPVLGSGKYEQNPVHVDDVAWAALACLETPATLHKTYDLGGAAPMAFNEMLREILRARGRRKTLLHIPLPICGLMARTLGLILRDPPVTMEHVNGVKLAAHIDNTPAKTDFGYQPRSFAVGLREVWGK